MRAKLVLAAAVGVLTACAGDAANKAADSATAAAAAVPATPVVLTVTAKEFAFESTDTVTAGMVTIKLLNQGAELHHVQLVRLSDGKTYADLQEGLKNMKPGSPPPPWMHDMAGPNSPVPGGESSITQELQPGNYAILCFIPGPDQIPHVMKGMMKPLTVIPATTASAPAPVADISVMMTDYAWQVTPEITAGKHIIKLENNATQSHEMLIAKLEPGKTVADLAKWVHTMKGPPPATPLGGTSGQSKGDVVYVPIDLAPGEYGLMCFMPDAKDGKMHAEHGMMKQFTVK